MYAVLQPETVHVEVCYLTVIKLLYLLYIANFELE